MSAPAVYVSKGLRLAPRCDRCRARHDPAVTCWRGRYVALMVAATLEQWGRVCYFCHRAGADSADHVTPRSYWGTDDLENLRPSHRRCNQRRGNNAGPLWGARVIVVTAGAAASAAAGDVLVDVTALALALSPPGTSAAAVPAHVWELAAAASVDTIRRAQRVREPISVWLIHPEPSPDELAAYQASGARILGRSAPAAPPPVVQLSSRFRADTYVTTMEA